MRPYDAFFICEGLRAEEVDSRGVGGRVMICGPAGRGTLQFDAREAQSHTNHGTTSKRLHRVLCIVFFSMCVANRACALVVCGKRRTRKTIVLSARQTDNKRLFSLENQQSCCRINAINGIDLGLLSPSPNRGSLQTYCRSCAHVISRAMEESLWQLWYL